MFLLDDNHPYELSNHEDDGPSQSIRLEASFQTTKYQPSRPIEHINLTSWPALQFKDNTETMDSVDPYIPPLR